MRDDALAELSRHLQAEIERAQVPGLAFALLRPGAPAAIVGLGATAASEGTPVTARTLFRIGSVTKPLVGTAVMRLVERGLVELDRPVRHWLPWLTLAQAGAAEQLTLRLLLSHQGGLPLMEEESGSGDPGTLEAWLQTRLPTAKLIALPGKVYSYSNAGLALVARVLEVASGEPLAQLMAHEVFEPLGMTRTTFDLAVAATYPLAQSHRMRADGQVEVEHRFVDNAPLRAAGFAYSTAEDMAAFARMQLEHGMGPGGRYLSEESIRALHHTEVDLLLPGDEGYALTFFARDYRGIRQLAHQGTISGFATQLLLAPDRGTGVFLAMNRTCRELDSQAVADRLFELVNDLPEQPPGRMEPPDPGRPQPPFPAQFAGTYLGPIGLVRIHADSGGPVAELAGEQIPLFELRPGVYGGPDPFGEPFVVGFVPEPEGPAAYAVIKFTVCQRVAPPPPLAPDRSEWGRWVGSYVGHGTRLEVRVVGEELRMSGGPDQRDYRCEPLGGARFGTLLGLAEFSADGPGPAERLLLCEAFTMHREPAAPIRR